MNLLKKKETVFIAAPSYNGQIYWSVTNAMHGRTSRRKDMNIITANNTGSLLANMFNGLWCAALNQRKEQNIKWFAMIHADIEPEPYWLDTMLDQANLHHADLLSAVVPIKNNQGLTSTAISSDDPYMVHSRLTLQQVHKLPPTFSGADACNLLQINTLPPPLLLVNTGLMVVRMDRPWSDKLYFTISDQIRKNIHGKFYPAVEPEDWFFSRLVNGYGGKVMATRAVKVNHIGEYRYTNHQPWGLAVDEEMQRARKADFVQ